VCIGSIVIALSQIQIDSDMINFILLDKQLTIHYSAIRNW